MEVHNMKKVLERTGIDKNAYAINAAEYPNDSYRRLIRSMRLLSEMDRQESNKKGKPDKAFPEQSNMWLIS